MNIPLKGTCKLELFTYDYFDMAHIRRFLFIFSNELMITNQCFGWQQARRSDTRTFVGKWSKWPYRIHLGNRPPLNSINM